MNKLTSHKHSDLRELQHEKNTIFGEHILEK